MRVAWSETEAVIVWGSGDRGSGKAGKWGGTHLAGWRVGVGQLGVGGFQLFKLAKEPVEFGVADLGRVLLMVEPVVTLQLLPQQGCPGRYLLKALNHHSQFPLFGGRSRPRP